MFRLKKWLHAGLNYLIPATCLLCGNASLNTKNLCIYCAERLPWLTHCCYQCGLPFHHDHTQLNTRCGQCIHDTPAFDTTIALTHYKKPVDDIITRLKFQKNLCCAKLMGDVMAQKLAQSPLYEKPDCIIPMPLHRMRLRERGFNQALEIAKPISKKLHIPINPYFCERVKNTKPQSDLKLTERAQNMRHAFQILEAAPMKHIAIVDDVMTTGSSLRELTKVIKKSGVSKISVWVFARTVL